MEANVFTQPGQKSVIVPHTFGAGPLADFNWPNARFDCLLEMYQGCRGSYEAWRAPDKEKRGGHAGRTRRATSRRTRWPKGNVYGFVSFSDHGSTHNSWACGLGPDGRSRGHARRDVRRRTYAASDEMILKVTADGHMAGRGIHGAGWQSRR